MVTPPPPYLDDRQRHQELQRQSLAQDRGHQRQAGHGRQAQPSLHDRRQRPGVYEFYCDICCGGRANPSMVGRLEVTG